MVERQTDNTCVDYLRGADVEGVGQLDGIHHRECVVDLACHDVVALTVVVYLLHKVVGDAAE